MIIETYSLALAVLGLIAFIAGFSLMPRAKSPSAHACTLLGVMAGFAGVAVGFTMFAGTAAGTNAYQQAANAHLGIERSSWFYPDGRVDIGGTEYTCTGLPEKGDFIDRLVDERGRVFYGLPSLKREANALFAEMVGDNFSCEAPDGALNKVEKSAREQS